MIIYLQFGFSQFISFREENLWNFSQSEHIIGPGSHVEYPTGTKNRNIVEDHPRNIPAKCGSNWHSGFGEESWNVKSLLTTDDERQVMAIFPMDLWSRWTKKHSTFQYCNISILQCNISILQLQYGNSIGLMHEYWWLIKSKIKNITMPVNATLQYGN